MGIERVIVRLGVPALLVGSCVGAAAVSWHAATSEIPSFAFGSHVVLAVQVALLLFYGAMLLLVPLMRALFDGDLPVELSLRGARWKEGVFGFGEKSLARQAEAEERAVRADADIKEEIHHLRRELKEGDLAQEEIADQALGRIKLLEEAVGSRETRR
jgi:hypothetical protein